LTIYADSSFFASHYLQDAHSTDTDLLLQDHPMLWLTPFHRAEIAHALYRHVFRGLISKDEAKRTWAWVDSESAQGIWVAIDLPRAAWEAAVDLARRHGARLGIRALDSLHVACALELGAERFWTFDERQARLAKAVGLKTNS
jgi:predicted nucleic acid-binding protein